MEVSDEGGLNRRDIQAHLKMLRDELAKQEALILISKGAVKNCEVFLGLIDHKEREAAKPKRRKK